MQSSSQATAAVMTIGHSNHALPRFLELLRMHGIQAVVDTRSHPYSDFSPQFDREALSKKLTEADLFYVGLGKELGGRPKGEEFYDPKGHVYYDKLAASAPFQEGLARLKTGMRRYKLAILCSEENPAVCHRALLIARVLREQGCAVQHIRGDGSVQSDEEVAAQADHSNGQIALFAEVEASKWKSIPSVLRKKRRSSSSAF